jgi:DDE family transposase
MTAALARVRGWVWTLPGGVPPVLNDNDEPVCIDLDATLVTAHSDKDGAVGTYKGGFGFAPNLAFLDRGDGTGEALAGILRPGNATANNAADNIDLLEAALQALPALPEGKQVVVRGDSGLATKAFLAYARQAGVCFSVSFELSDAIKAAIRALPETAWQPAVRQNGEVREGAMVAELTDCVMLPEGWPEDARLVVRREPRHPGAQLTFDDIDSRPLHRAADRLGRRCGHLGATPPRPGAARTASVF